MKDRPVYFSHTQGKIFYLILVYLVISKGVTGHLYAQSPANESFRFLTVPVSARMAGMGGVNVSLSDKDVNFFYSNPALNGDTLSGVASASYQFYAGDIGHAGISFAKDFAKLGMMTFGIQHMNYGTINGYDASGNETGDFRPGETSLMVSRSHQILNYRLGATLKGVFSNIAGNNASAIALDIGGVFIHPYEQLTVGMVIRNMGWVLSDYSQSANSDLPFDVQVGTTFKPEHMPIRFSLSVFDLINSRNRYDDPDSDPGTLKQLLAHANFGAEILIHKNLNILAGYNYIMHNELRLQNGGGGAGFTFGLSVSVKKFDFVVSRSAFVAGNASYSFTLSRNFNSLF